MSIGWVDGWEASINPAGSADRPPESDQKGMGIHRGCVHDWPSYQSRKPFFENVSLDVAKLPYDLHQLRDMGIFYPSGFRDNHTTATIVISSTWSV